MTESSVLTVLLHGVAVGRLALADDGLCEFRLLDSYKTAYPRQVLGQRFLDDVDGVWRARSRLPVWFSNLLPEGPLRELVAAKAGVSPQREFFLLRHLGADLPGAISIVAEGVEFAEQDSGHGGSDAGAGTTWHFSLAGVQLKFSASREGRGMTIPVSGAGGDWILKLPDARYAGVPANEHATMQWARQSGIEVPETDLVDISQVSGLPPEVGVLREGVAYAIRRFDRPGARERLHIEDFAQVLGLFPEQKYRSFNYETIGRIVHALSGDAGLQTFVRRLVFVIASGNGDAHHKNWSLLYRDGVQAQLSPAYDLVSTIQYMPNDLLALNFDGSKRWVDASLESFRRMARKLQVDERVVVDAVASSMEDVLQSWSRSAEDFGYSRAERERLDAHLASIPLLASGR